MEKDLRRFELGVYAYYLDVVLNIFKYIVSY